MCSHTWATSVNGRRCIHCGEERIDVRLPRHIAYGDKQPIVIRSTRPRTADEMREMWEILAAFPWPVLALDHDWEVHGG